MRPDHRDAALLLDIVGFSDEIQLLVQRAGPADFLADLATRRAIERCVELVGEAASHVSDAFR